jgi:hypothetical protein
VKTAKKGDDQLMKREELAALGLTDDQTNAIINLHSEDLKNYVPKTRLDEVIEERNGLRDQIAERDKQIKTLGESAGDNQALKDQIAQLQADNQKASEEYESNLAQIRLDNAVEIALTGAKAKNSKAVRALLDLTKSKVGEDGKVEGLEAQIKAIQKSDAYLFDGGEPAQPKIKGITPQDGAGKPAPKAVNEMTYSEMCAHLAAGGTLE